MVGKWMFIICTVSVCFVAAEKSVLEDLSDKQVENLAELCDRKESLFTIAMSTSWAPFNVDAEQCRTMVFERKYLSVNVNNTLFSIQKLDASLLIIDSATGAILGLEMTTLATMNQVEMLTIIIKVEDTDFENAEVTASTSSNSSLQKSVIHQMEASQAYDKICYYGQKGNWTRCINSMNHNVTTGNFSAEGCNLILDARISNSVQTMRFPLYFMAIELTHITVLVLREEVQWLVNEEQSICTSSTSTELASTTEEPMLHKYSQTSADGWLIFTIVLATSLLLVLVAVACYYFCFKSRKGGKSISLAEEESLRQSSIAREENLENGSVEQ